MTTTQRGVHTTRRALLVMFAGWVIVVLVFFALHHPVRAGRLWLDHLGAVACVGLLAVGACVLGRRILVSLDALPARWDERVLVSTGLGFVALTYATLALGLAGALHRSVAWLLIAAAWVLAWREIRSTAREIVDGIRERGQVGLASAGLALVAAPFLLATLWFALAPVSAHDALVYHLNLPKHYAEGHRIAPLPLNVYSNMPHNLEVLSTLAYLAGGEPAARVMDFVWRLAVSTAVFALARRLLSTPASLVAVLVFLLNPIVSSARTVGNIDLGMAFFFVIAVMIGWETSREDRSRGLWLVALLAGYLMGCKYTGLFYAASLLALLVLDRPRISGRSWALAGALALAPVVPWLVKNAAMTGNPVYPLLPTLFASREWDGVLGQQLVEWQRSMGMGRSLGDYLLLPWNLAVEGQMGRNYRYFDGVLSPLFLAVIPLVLLLKTRGPWLRLLGLTVVPFIGWAATSQQMRFLIPVFPLLSVATAGILWSLDREGWGSERAVARALGVLLVLGCLAVYQVPATARNAARALPVVTGEISREEYLAEAVQSFPVIHRANEVLPPEAKVLMVWENNGYYLERPYWADSFFEASQVARLAARAGTPAAFADFLLDSGFTHVIYNHGLGRFFERVYGPEYAGFLRAFVSHRLEPMYSERDVTLYRLTR